MNVADHDTEGIVHGANGANDANGANGANRNENEIDSYLEKTIFDFLSSHSSASITEICSETNISKRTIQRIIKKLEDKGVIRKGGTRKNPLWIVNFDR